jgi:DNA-binding response OmpR family regulator
MFNNQDSISGADTALAQRAVLIVEDEALLSVMLEGLVREMGAREVHVHGDPDEARLVAESAALDCAILDVQLGNRNSFEVADALDARSVPYIFSSAISPVDLDGRYRHKPLLGKPFSDAELRAHLLDLLRC